MSDQLPGPILFVDDEPRVLEGIERLFADDFELLTASGGAEGLALLGRTSRPVALVVSDMQMPGMDGAAFLGRVAEAHPASVRILLTGQAGVDSAIRAVNDGKLFRFLRKPCPEPELRQTITAGLRQFELQSAERLLLNDTIGRVTGLLASMLGLYVPEVAEQGPEIQRLSAHITAQLDLPDRWVHAAVCRLWPLGLVSLPSDLIQRAMGRARLNKVDGDAWAKHAEVGARLLADIPRFEPVAEIVRRQGDAYADAPPSDVVRTGVILLRVCRDVNAEIRRGTPFSEVLLALQPGAGPLAGRMLHALESLRSGVSGEQTLTVPAKALRVGMVLLDPLTTKAGVLLTPAGREIDPVTLERIRRFIESSGLKEPIRVRVPGEDSVAQAA